jgi:hypothetical protein
VKNHQSFEITKLSPKKRKKRKKKKTVVVVGPQNVLSFSLKPKRIKPLPSTFYIGMEIKPCQS